LLVQRELLNRSGLDIGLLKNLDLALRVADSYLGPGRRSPEQSVYHHRHVVVDRQLVHVHDLDDGVERRWRFSLEHGFLSTPPLGLLVAQRHRLDSSDEVR